MKLYYYTTAETMKFILNGGNIYATNMKYMNDSEEYVNGLKEVRTLLQNQNDNTRLALAAKEMLTDKVLEEILDKEVDSFSISFTKCRDLLSQWSMYAKESGVSLGIDFGSTPSKFLVPDQESKIREAYQLFPKKVYYFTESAMSPKQYKSVGKNIIMEIQNEIQRQGFQELKEYIRDLWFGITPYVKRADFHAEGEYRLVFDLNRVLAFSPKVGVRNDKNVLKPYLDISMEEGWPITEIIVGPGFNQEAVFRSIAYFLNKVDIKVPINCSILSKKIKKYMTEIDDRREQVTEGKKLQSKWKNLYNEFKKYNDVEKKQSIHQLYLEFEKTLYEVKTSTEFLEVKEYIDNNHFSSKGIVLRKSQIPYLF